MSDDSHKKREQCFRLFVRIGQERLYASQDPGRPWPFMQWLSLETSYPQTFSKREKDEVVKHYNDQRVESYRFGLREVKEEQDA